jgi:hypothetical protein
MVYFIWKSKFFRQRVYTILGGDLMGAFLTRIQGFRIYIDRAFVSPLQDYRSVETISMISS